MTSNILSRLFTNGTHLTGEPVADLVERRERERAKEMAARQQWLAAHPVPAETDVEKTQPLFRVGDARRVFQILDGRGLVEHVIDNFDTQDCEWCHTKIQQPTAVRISVGEQLNHSCLKPSCFHQALEWTHAKDETDRDILVEIAARPAQVLA